MRFQRHYALGLICLMAVLTGSTHPSEARPTVFTDHVTGQADGIPRITAQELLSELRRRKAILVDVRGLDAYKEGHIKGAISIPVDQVEARLNELPRGKLIATYCSWPAEHTSARAAQVINEGGTRRAAAVLGGYDALVKAGLAKVKSR